MPTIAGYGTWRSPITSDLIVAQSLRCRRRGSTAKNPTGWKAGHRSKDASSSCDAEGPATTDVTPKPYSARTRVHEYGGASWTVADGVGLFLTLR